MLSQDEKEKIMNLYTHSIFFHAIPFIFINNFENSSTESGELLIGKNKRIIQRNSNRHQKELINQIDLYCFSQDISLKYSYKSNKGTTEKKIQKKWKEYLWEEIIFPYWLQLKFSYEYNYLIKLIQNKFSFFKIIIENGELLNFQQEKKNYKNKKI